MFRGISAKNEKSFLFLKNSKDSGFVLVMTLGILLALSVFFAGIAGLLRMKSALINQKYRSFEAGLESQNEMIQREWNYETR